LNQVVKHWREWGQIIGLGATETEAERMERLGSATKKTAEETAELNKYKKEQAAVEEVLKIQSEAQRTQAAQVKEARSVKQPTNPRDG